MKILTYIVAILAILSGTVWSWQSLVTQVPPATIAAALPVMRANDASMKAEPQPADEAFQPARLTRADLHAGPSPIYPATPAKHLLGSSPPLPRAVVARQKALAKASANQAMAALAKASPREAKLAQRETQAPARERPIAAREASAKSQAASAERVTRSYRTGEPLQLHPPHLRLSDPVATSYSRRWDSGQPQAMGYAQERPRGLLSTLLN